MCVCWPAQSIHSGGTSRWHGGTGGGERRQSLVLDWPIRQPAAPLDLSRAHGAIQKKKKKKPKKSRRARAPPSSAGSIHPTSSLLPRVGLPNRDGASGSAQTGQGRGERGGGGSWIRQPLCFILSHHGQELHSSIQPLPLPVPGGRSRQETTRPNVPHADPTARRNGDRLSS